MTLGPRITTSRISDECLTTDPPWVTTARAPQTITARSTQTSWGTIKSPCPHCTPRSQTLARPLPRNLPMTPSRPWIIGLLWRDHWNRKTTQITTGMSGKHRGALPEGSGHGILQHSGAVLGAAVARGQAAEHSLCLRCCPPTGVAADGALKGLGPHLLLLWFGLHSCTLAPTPILACHGLPPRWVLGRGDFMYQLHWAASSVKESMILRVSDVLFSMSDQGKDLLDSDWFTMTRGTLPIGSGATGWVSHCKT